MEEKDGVPQSLVGLSGFAQDEVQLQCEQLLACWIAPRLAGVSFATVPLAPGKVAFIIRIPRSWSAPHMVTFNGTNRFYSRHSSGKYQMDVNELRAAFLQSAKAGEHLRNFRLERVNRIAAGEVGMKLWGKTCVVLHLLPAAEPAAIDLPRAVNLPLRPMGRISGFNHQMTLEAIRKPVLAAELNN